MPPLQVALIRATANGRWIDAKKGHGFLTPQNYFKRGLTPVALIRINWGGMKLYNTLRVEAIVAVH